MLRTVILANMHLDPQKANHDQLPQPQTVREESITEQPVLGATS
jgi:hypothetical protein